MTQLQPDGNIPPQIYELATSHNVGTPLKRQCRRLLQMILLFEMLFGLFLLGLLGYDIYGYVAFNLLSHTYPNINSVPDSQLDHYISLQVLHDQLWPNILQVAILLFTWLGQLMTFSVPVRTKLYICTDGLLKIGKRKVEAVRWDEVKELSIPNGSLTRLVRQDGHDIFLPQLLMSGRHNTLNTLIIDEVTRRLFPTMLASYERSETITFGDLRVNQKGIYGPEGLVEWERIRNITREKHKILIYYKKIEGSNKGGVQKTPVSNQWQWHTWRKSVLSSATWPNLPVFVTLVNAILDQRGVNSVEGVPLSQQPDTVREMAMRAKRRGRRKKRLLIGLTIVLILGLLSLAIGIPIYQSVQQDQRAARDTQLLRVFYTQRAHKPYVVQVPGEHCGKGKAFWLDDDSANIYACQPDGLVMTQKNFQYQDGEYFTFVDDELSQAEAFSGVNYFPHHYRVQVQATILSGGPSTCVSVEVHIQHFQGRQWFDVCADGSWDYGRCDIQCNTDTQVASGTLAQASKTYSISVEVTDSVLTLDVNHTQITSLQDTTYTSTNQLELALSGDQHAGEPITARFSNFSYTPLP